MKVYLDYAATTPIAKEVAKAMALYLSKDFGNASSLHQWGQKTREAIEVARQQLVKFLNCSSTEVFFTGSATEADNLAIFGLIKAARKNGIVKPHVITSAIEHPAVLEPIKRLEKLGEIEATYLPVGREGTVKVEDVERAINLKTILISIMYANNEIGTVQPIAEIGHLLQTLRQVQGKLPTKIYFHTDAVQAANFLDCDVKKLGCDLLTLSGHKIYGPKGVGALYVKKGAAIEPIMFGGHQESGLRQARKTRRRLLVLEKP